MLLEKLSMQSGIDKSRLMNFAASASFKYKVYEIPKRNGETREICQPSRAVKSVQKWCVREVLQNLPVHECAYAYRKGVGIRQNAERHLGYNYTLRVDFSDFFPSFKIDGVFKFLNHCNGSKDIQLNDDDVVFLSKIFCRHSALTIGAPSSPALTNCMMYSLDQEIQAVCGEFNCIYTRYADDIFISTNNPHTLENILDNIKTIVTSFPYAKLIINPEKTRYLSQKYRKKITGLVITDQKRISIGRKRKRILHSWMHRASNGELDDLTIEKLKGWIAFVHSIEPQFVDSLKRKYGELHE